MRRGLRLTALLAALLGPGMAVAQTADPAALQAAAETGDPAAQWALAQRYHSGQGVLQNFAEAARWAEAAAKAGNAEAQNLLGRYAFEGLGRAADRQAALRWFAAASAQGAPQHLFDHATALQASSDPEDLTTAADLFAQAAEAGHPQAAVSLGVMFQEGQGVAQDLDRARQLYEGPAAQGLARAQNNLGLLYARGSGVPQDYERAAALFAAAAEQGLRPAMTNLGVMYENGFGVPVDEDRAMELYRRGGGDSADKALPGVVYDPRLKPADPAARAALRQSAEAGDPVAQFQLGWLLLQGPGPTLDDRRRAAALFQAAAEKGHAPSMANLGLLYATGHGVLQDYVAAQMWLTLAGSAGLAEAPALSAALQARMTAGQINEAQALAAAHWSVEN